MLIEVHMIRNHSPANLNRGGLGAPSTCLFGGVTRARISSQRLKRSIRRSAAFQTAMEKDGGVRAPRSPDPAALPECLGGKAAAAIALCGRMAERDPKGPFRTVGRRVAPALSAAHAISTHEVVSEVNSLTAEGPPAGGGAGDISEARRASVCSYTYLCVDWQQLVANLNGDAELAKRTVRQFLYAAATSTPGRQSSFAPFSLPEGILVEVKTEPAVPMSYVNAFAEPVPREARRGLIEESIARLGEHVRDMASGYGFPAERFWFSPSGRYPLTGVEDRTERTAADGIESTGSFEILVDAVVEAVEAQVGA